MSTANLAPAFIASTSAWKTVAKGEVYKIWSRFSWSKGEMSPFGRHQIQVQLHHGFWSHQYKQVNNLGEVDRRNQSQRLLWWESFGLKGEGEFIQIFKVLFSSTTSFLTWWMLPLWFPVPKLSLLFLFRFSWDSLMVLVYREILERTLSPAVGALRSD